jgi:GTP cyclohydrolase I
VSHALVEDAAVWRPRVCQAAPTADLDAATRAAAAFLGALGLDLDDETTAETPRRMAAAYAEMLTGVPFDFTTFPNTEQYDELILVHDIPVRSLCEHHMLPFTGVAHLGYLPAHRILGLSKLARLVDLASSRPQTQERLTQQVADRLTELLQPRGAGVVVEAEHTCMSLRGARAAGARTVTSALHGTMREDASARSEFLALTRVPRGRS